MKTERINLDGYGKAMCGLTQAATRVCFWGKKKGKYKLPSLKPILKSKSKNKKFKQAT